MTDTLRWGILGTGGIAHKFAIGLSAAPGAELVAVGSRTSESAEKFGAQYNIPNRHSSYEALASDPNVDAIYVATPHPFHAENSILCLEAGKAVLCEKPFTINAAEADQVIALARAKKLFLMEAMWSRYLPAIVRLKELVQSGLIGDLRMLVADFGYRASFQEEGRLFAPELGGGALLDVGIYPISLAYFLLGEPAQVAGFAGFAPTGVDEQNVVIFNYAGGQLAKLSSASRTSTLHQAIAYGTEGSIIVPDWWHGEKLIVRVNGKPEEIIDLPLTGNGYNYEALEVARCIHAGLTESPVMPLDETRTIMNTLDAIRAQWGMKYPGE